MTTKERLLFYWQSEVEDRFKEWLKAQESGDKESAEKAKARYVSARKSLDEIEKREDK